MDSTKGFLWSKTTLITGGVGGAWVDPPSWKTNTFFPWSLALTGCSEAECNFIDGLKWQKNEIYITNQSCFIIKTVHHFILYQFIFLKFVTRAPNFKKVEKLVKKFINFFFFKINFLMKTFHFETIWTYFKMKKKFQKFYVMIIFLKNSNSKFFFETSIAPRRMNGIYGLWGP